MLQIQNREQIPRRQNQGNEVRKKIQHYSFCLGDKIGKGFSSTVYKGRNDQTNQIVAIKVIQLRSLRDHITKNLLRTELQCIKKISHQNLLKYIDSYETINNCYIITQYCDGGDLEKQLKIKGKLNQLQFNDFFSQFYQGYQNFLNSGYIHRDLKPANIFLKGGQIKIADFGMVKKISQNPRDSYNVGTPVYMPPQSIFSNIYTQKSDVWAIGVMCYQLTHGSLPWKGINEQQLKLSIQNDQVNFDYNLVSADFVKFVQQCLDKNPNNRISVAEMIGHPWMQKIVPSIITPNLTPNRYFAGQICTKINIKHNNSMINQAPLQSTQKNISIPMVRNTTTPKPLTNNLLAIPLINRQSQNINTSNTNRLFGTKIQRSTMDSQGCPRKKNNNNHMDIKIHNYYGNYQYNKNKKSVLDYLVSILNYLRYLYKIVIIIEQKSNYFIRDNIKKIIKSAMVKQMMRCFEKLQKIIKNQQNVFGLHGWDEFIKGKKWATFKGVIQQYQQKYNKLFERQKIDEIKKQTNELQQKKQKRLSIQLGPQIQSLYNVIKNYLQTTQKIDVNHQIFKIIQIVDYLIAIYNIQEMIFMFGWLYLTENSPINAIVQCKSVVDRNNYQDIWEKVGNKFQVITHKIEQCS